nr:MAG TPA: hypothetical protein [Caudoviricetes sp.]
MSFNTIKTIVSNPQKPMLLPFELLLVLIFIYSYLYTVRFYCFV